MRLDGCSLHLSGRHGRGRTRSLSGSGRRKVWLLLLLLARVEHDGGRRVLLLNRMDGSGRTRSGMLLLLEMVLPGVVVVLVVDLVRRGQVRQLMVVVWMVGRRRHRRSASAVRRHHFGCVGSRGPAKSHTHSGRAWKRAKDAGEARKQDPRAKPHRPRRCERKQPVDQTIIDPVD